MRVILLGPPGAGKGTQATRIVNEFNIAHISTGEIFRQNIKAGTELGEIAKRYIDQGMLVPDEIAINIIRDRLQKEDCKNGFLLDGFPRNAIQADELDEVLSELHIELNHVVNIEVDDQVLIERIVNRRVCTECEHTFHLVYNPPKNEGVCDICGAKLYQREDDTVETVTRRLDIYHELTKPLIDYYDQHGILVSVNGLQSINDVFGDIAKAIGSE
ncbi:MAG: adenylate kinase [Tissierellales bacterium]|nr:adenylate kinase [Tissierellales bacterium]